jgi:hypothetical protein
MRSIVLLCAACTASPRPASPVAAPRPASTVVASALRAMSLDERCALASLLARQLVELMEWDREFPDYVPGDRARMIVFVEREDAKLITADEACAPTVVPLVRKRGGAISVVHAGREQDGWGAPYLLLWLVPDASNVDERRFEFHWPRNRAYHGGSPAGTSPGAPTVRVGVATGLHAAPRIEIAIRRRGDVLDVLRSAQVMWRRSAPATQGGGSRP